MYHFDGLKNYGLWMNISSLTRGKMLHWLLAMLFLITLDTTSAHEHDSRYISYEDLTLTAKRFSEPGVSHFSKILFDVSRDQLVVGARDSLYRLSLNSLQKLEKALWLAPAEKVKMCQVKGQSEMDCHNFIKVLLTNGRKLFTCGTNAFSPQCSWREMEDVSRVSDWVRGVAMCPYSPYANSTSLLTDAGVYFAGSPMDFTGADSAIVRDLGALNLRTIQYNSKWLNEPQFVGSFETESFVFFMFRESAVEYINCGKIVYSRIARVCKNDSGGQHQNICVCFYLHETLFLNSIAGSAICSFNLTAIQAAFNGPFKHQETSGSAWERSVSHQHTRHAQCLDSATPKMSELSRYQLMDAAVQPVTQDPLYVGKLETITHIAVDVLATKYHRAVHVLYVATVEGYIKKISVLTRTQKTCVLEVWRPFPVDSPQTNILSLSYLKETDSIYVGLEDSLLRIPTAHCSRHRTAKACMNSMDPYCGWNELKEQCLPPPNRDPLASYWQQNATQCPVLTHPVAGGWSAWSAWTPCSQVSATDDSAASGGDSAASGGDQCLCATRRCDNPPALHGGAPCQGIATRVTNCTVHGSWTAWSAWSDCSQTCGVAVKTRRRACGNPAPAHGGRVCVGTDTLEMYCHSNPPCPAPSAPVRDGAWSAWGAWGECSARCGGGYRVRTRRCDNPPPQAPGGLDCAGCHLDYETCNTAACIDSKRLSNWTPWMAVGNGTEKRVRFACRAPTPDPAHIKITQAKEEERVCQADGVCLRSGRVESEDLWSDWSSWSPCSVECGGGQQFRERKCEGRPDDCQGPPRVARVCNTHNCRGEWSCWAEWSKCSVSCGIGMRQRTRHCMAVNNKDQDGTGCEGPSVGTDICEMPTCQSLQGWDNWSPWTPCDSGQQEHRTRQCLALNPGPELCQGHSRESRMCLEMSNDLSPMNAQSTVDSRSRDGLSTFSIVVLCLICLMAGGGMALGGCYWWQQRRKPSLPGSPHYISSKQNPYVTVPLKEVHSPKRTPSFSAKPANGTPKLFAKQPGDYETATIKRNSHSMNGHIRADLEQDKFF
ncbi:semaphorin-5B [Nilaparvata lugens]|uniref:semaphorin-5B n=1 Tax=Nilaparvata lugens TaxID=108931 RepID=UPI00193D1A99|nr:semaphorin-5B [Nilaparvata lugens]